LAFLAKSLPSQEKFTIMIKMQNICHMLQMTGNKQLLNFFIIFETVCVKFSVTKGPYFAF